MRVILASASPRRREILARVTWPFDVLPAEIDERRLGDEDPEAHVRRLARDKALRLSREHPGAWVLGADTVVAQGDDIFGKPVDDADACRMLARLAAASHLVLTGFAWARGGEVVHHDVSRSAVCFRELADGEIRDYVATGEPHDKAGAYAIQGGAARFVASVQGSVTGVIGLPLEGLEESARRLGIPEPVSPLPAEAVALRLRAVQGEVAARTVAAGRSPESCRLVAVTKGHPAALVQAAIAAGATDVGENYVQEGARKRAEVAQLGGAATTRWHFIGPLQTNKAALAVRSFDLFHAIDRLEVADALVRRATQIVSGLLQVNVARDPKKAGVAPEDVVAHVRRLAELRGFELRGLMTIGPLDADATATRRTFASLRQQVDDLRGMGYERVTELSMGMSDDYPEAIAEGATLVRLGTAIFGPRVRPAGAPA
ncbi:YggS family pyridoxal phosphate-dependent enzyme [Candidatus Binatia bacterium]|jgi:MAF protein|nr:YggS family pyridoxal phosphate-dependent enzyme [Candidatus Binatia bacterium]